MEQSTTVARDIELDLPADGVWDLIGNPDGWSEWMVDDADVVVEPGAEGTVRDGDEERVVRIREVVEGESVSFDWWHRGDEPGASVVELVVTPTAAGAVLRMTETFPAVQHLAARASIAWDVRATCAWALCQAFAAA